MADIVLTQAEAEALMAMEKHRADEERRPFPGAGASLVVPLVSADGKEAFSLDVHRGRIDLSKVTYQNRARQVIILLRLDLGAQPHRNPDDVEVGSPHLHVYREGYGDKWARPVDPADLPDVSNPYAALESFMTHCNIAERPHFLIERELFQ